MTDIASNATHFRLIAALRAIGHYLRETESQEEQYVFDCLSVCVNDKKSPEDREFWGWWMTLDPTYSAENCSGFVATFKAGLYNKDGNWDSVALPKSARDEVIRTQQDFTQKLSKMLDERFGLSFILHENSEEFIS